MKKIFLAIGMLSVGFAKAQQPELFNIDKYLLERSKQKSISRSGLQLFLNYTTPIADTAVFSYLTPNGDKIYILRQDNMPCVVPGTEQHIMPNISLNRFSTRRYIRPGRGTIPNAVPPHAIITDKK